MVSKKREKNGNKVIISKFTYISTGCTKGQRELKPKGFLGANIYGTMVMNYILAKEIWGQNSKISRIILIGPFISNLTSLKIGGNNKSKKLSFFSFSSLQFLPLAKELWTQLRSPQS